MKIRRPRHAVAPRPFGSSASTEALRHHELLKTHMAGLRPERITEVPPCAAGLSLSSWRAVVIAMNDALADRHVLARFAGDHFRTLFADGSSREFGLAQVSSRCRDAALDEIPSRVRAHLHETLGAPQPCALPEEVTFESAAPRLIAQIHRADALGTAGEYVLSRPLCDGLLSVLSLDLGFAIGTFHRSMTARWGRSDDELFRLGLENLRRRPVEKLPLPGHTNGGFMLYANDIALCAQVQLLSSHLGRHLPAGALVTMPSRHTLFCFPMRAGSWEEVGPRVTAAIRVAVGMFHEVAAKTRGEAVFSPDLYWWRDGRLHPFPSSSTAVGTVIMPPEEFCNAVTAHAPCDAN